MLGEVAKKKHVWAKQTCLRERMFFFCFSFVTFQCGNFIRLVSGFIKEEQNNILTHFEYAEKLSNPKSDFLN